MGAGSAAAVVAGESFIKVKLMVSKNSQTSPGPLGRVGKLHESVAFYNVKNKTPNG